MQEINDGMSVFFIAVQSNKGSFHCKDLVKKFPPKCPLMFEFVIWKGLFTIKFNFLMVCLLRMKKRFE